MIQAFFFVVFVCAVILLFGLVQLLLLRQLNRVWWRKTWIRRAAWALPLLGVAFFLLFAAGTYYNVGWLSFSAAAVSSIILISEICLMFSLPVSGAIHLADRLLDRFIRHRRRVDGEPPDRHRRVFLKAAAAAVPMVTVATGMAGVGRAFAGANVYRMVMTFRDLPDDLRGLRILHLSDLHLRHYVTVDDLEKILATAETLRPDLTLVTGDIADDIDQLADALRLMSRLNPRLGTYAIPGNHEYFRGMPYIRVIFSRSTVPLFIDQGVSLAVGGSRLYLAGIDDPVTMGGIREGFFTEHIDTALATRGKGDFTVLMSHRPDAFPHAAHRGVHLTLAGHTHGGQIGCCGRSLLESQFPEKYLWGHYRIGERQLYTSSGAGHWFPFRLGCPPEAPVIELQKG